MRKLVTLTLLTVAASQVNASPWAYVQQNPEGLVPAINVHSDSATQWDRVDQSPLTFYVDARGRCDDTWRVQYESDLDVVSGGTHVADLALNGLDWNNQSYGPNHGGGWEELDGQGAYQDPDTQAPPAAMCNQWLQQEAAASSNPAQRKRELLANGIRRIVQGAYKAEFRLVCLKKRETLGFYEPRYAHAEANLRAVVICHGNPAALDVPAAEPPAPPPQRKPDPVGISSMDIWANPSASATYRGFCPKKIHFGGEIRYVLPANGNPVDLRYRYVATQGANVFKSDVYTTQYTATGKKILKSWPLQFPLMTGGPQLSATTNSGEPDVYGGNVVLEFIGNPPIHANLQPVQFNVTCLKEGQLSEVAQGGQNTLASPTRPREPPLLPGNDGAPAPSAQVGGSKQVTIGANQTEAKTPAGKPDLVIRSVTRVPGNDRQLRVQIANIGTAPSAATRLTVFPPSGAPIQVEIKPVMIKSWSTSAIEAPFPLTGRVRLQIDAQGRVAESNENNNSYVLTGVSHSATEHDER